MIALFAFDEAVHSIALEHPDDHGCDICLAARGDLEAWIRLFVEAQTDAADLHG